MGALLDNATFLENNDLVGIDDCAESVRNHNDREALLLKQNVQGLLDLVLTLSIKS